YFFKGTRGKSWDGKMWSGRERYGIRERESRGYFVPDPFPSLVYVPTVYRPAVKRLVRVPTVSRSAVRCPPDFSRPTVCPVVPIPSRRWHAFFPIPQLTSGADVPIPFTTGFSFSHHM
ncbi:unnamed protein product, partial [Laminaria digitata]